MEEDKYLKDLGHFTGTEKYTRVPMYSSVITDGVVYVAENGYSWFITDMLSLIDFTALKKEEFLSVKLKINEDKTAVASIEDGNGKVFKTQNYKWTDAKVDVSMYWANNVLMLSGEY